MKVWTEDGGEIEFDEILFSDQIHAIFGGVIAVNVEAWQCGIIKKYRTFDNCWLRPGNILIFDRRNHSLGITNISSRNPCAEIAIV